MKKGRQSNNYTLTKKLGILFVLRSNYNRTQRGLIRTAEIVM